jgi:hypothetical protein
VLLPEAACSVPAAQAPIAVQDVALLKALNSPLGHTLQVRSEVALPAVEM